MLKIYSQYWFVTFTTQQLREAGVAKGMSQRDKTRFELLSRKHDIWVVCPGDDKLNGWGQIGDPKAVRIVPSELVSRKEGELLSVVGKWKLAVSGDYVKSYDISRVVELTDTLPLFVTSGVYRRNHPNNPPAIQGKAYIRIYYGHVGDTMKECFSETLFWTSEAKERLNALKRSAPEARYALDNIESVPVIA